MDRLRIDTGGSIYIFKILNYGRTTVPRTMYYVLFLLYLMM